jgi:hypothetical protein
MIHETVAFKNTSPIEIIGANGTIASYKFSVHYYLTGNTRINPR